jgi:selenocysteine lyase/cysteine desulfurase
MSTFIADSGVIADHEHTYEHISNDLRAVLAWLVNTTPDEIAFVQNTGTGLNIIANALPLQKDDTVVFCDMEFPANVYPWMNLRRKGIKTQCIPNDGGGLTVDALERHADPRTKVVAVSSVEFLTGFKNDLQALGTWCRERDIYFIVDAIQSLGAARLDAKACHIDFLACGGPKWLMGPQGLGFIYCRHELLDTLTPAFAGSMSMIGWEDWRDYNFAFLPDARRFEIGTANLLGQVGLLTAVRLLMGTTIAAIERWTLHLTQMLIEDLQNRGYHIVSNQAHQRRSAIVSFGIPDDVDQAYQKLIDANIIVSKRENYIRVSPHGYNTEDEIARIGETLGDAN